MPRVIDNLMVFSYFLPLHKAGNLFCLFASYANIARDTLEGFVLAIAIGSTVCSHDVFRKCGNARTRLTKGIGNYSAVESKLDLRRFEFARAC